MQVESQALNRAKALLVKLANPTPPKARAPSTEINPYFSSIDPPTHQSQNAFGSFDMTLADIKNLPKNYMTEVKNDNCGDDEKKSYARLASNKSQFKKNNLENSRKNWKMKKQQLDTSVGDSKREKSRQKSTENKVKEFITAFNVDKMKNNSQPTNDPRIWENKENQMKKGDMSQSRIRSNKQSSSSFLSYQTESKENRTRNDSSINLSMESGTRNRRSSGNLMGKSTFDFFQTVLKMIIVPTLVFKENLRDIVASKLKYSKQNIAHHQRDKSAPANAFNEIHRPKAKSISLANQPKKSTPCPNPSLLEVESESFVNEKNNISPFSENRKTAMASPFVKETQDKTTSRTSVNVSIDFLAKLLHSKQSFSYTPGNASIDFSLEGQKVDPVASVSLLDHLIKYHNESTDMLIEPKFEPIVENKNIAKCLASDADQRPSSCIGISKPYQDLRRPRPEEPSKTSHISQKPEKVSLKKGDSNTQKTISNSNYHSIQAEYSNKERTPIQGYKSVPYKRNYQNFENQANFPKVENLDRLLKLKYGYHSDLPRIPNTVDNNIPVIAKVTENSKKRIEEFRLDINIELLTETNRHEIFQTQQSTIDDEQKHSELCTNISFCHEKEEAPPSLPAPRDPTADHELEQLKAIFLGQNLSNLNPESLQSILNRDISQQGSSESLEEDSLEVSPKITLNKITNRTQKALPTTNREFETERNLSVSKRSCRKNTSHLQFHEIQILYQNDYKEQILSEFLNEETLICDYSPCFKQKQFPYDNNDE